MKRHILLLVVAFAALSLQAQVFGPGGAIKSAPAGSALGGQSANLPQPSYMVFVQPPMQMSQSFYGSQPFYGLQRFYGPQQFYGPQRFHGPQQFYGQQSPMTPYYNPYAYNSNSYNPYYMNRAMYGSMMIITPPRIPASWIATSMFGRQPQIVGKFQVTGN
jgi:hypothetical protein